MALLEQEAGVGLDLAVMELVPATTVLVQVALVLGLVDMVLGLEVTEARLEAEALVLVLGVL